jgi:hypothetical protein
LTAARSSRQEKTMKNVIVAGALAVTAALALMPDLRGG